ncbi:MAG: HEAT repeat domain-containing protein [Actinobacteria bacterium]|nr:HEAT repeat domain-containing protein [Actinomycetota bacterium]
MKDTGFSERAKLEINVNEKGVFIIANVEGYLALARLCTNLAEIHALIRSEPRDEDTDTIDGTGEYHLSMNITEKAIAEGRFIFSPGSIEPFDPEDPELDVPDVFFCVSDQIGAGFWKGRVKSGMEPELAEEYMVFAEYDPFERINELGGQGTKKSLDGLLEFIKGDDLVTKLYAIEQLITFYDVPEAKTVLMDLVRDADSAVRRYAIRTLANTFTDDDVKQAIATSLQDPDELVRAVASDASRDYYELRKES